MDSTTVEKKVLSCHKTGNVESTATQLCRLWKEGNPVFYLLGQRAQTRGGGGGGGGGRAWDRWVGEDSNCDFFPAWEYLQEPYVGPLRRKIKTYRRQNVRLLSLWFPLLHFWYFVKQFLEYMMREKRILNKLLNFQKNNVCAVGQRLHSPGNDYWLINKYKLQYVVIRVEQLTSACCLHHC